MLAYSRTLGHCLLQKVMKELEASKYEHAELKLTFYPHSADEWHRLAQWVTEHRLTSDHVCWLIEIPRL